MKRDEVFREIEGTLGLVPSMFKTLPDEALELEWGLFKQVQLSDDLIPAKYRELIGLAAGAVLNDRYCVAAHRELARACGATEEEIEYCQRLAKGVAGWGTYLSGSEISVETVSSEIHQICDFIKSGEMAGRAGGVKRPGVSTH